MHRFLRFPGFKRHALTFSYDDGTVFDKRLVEIFDKNGVKGTFNLNTGCMGEGRRLTKEECYELFANSPHEVAVHGAKHLILTEYAPATVNADVLLDRLELERQYGRIIRGMAYAYGTFNDEVVSVLENCGIVYSRTTVPTYKFDIPTDWLRLNPTCHHKDERLPELTEAFLDNTPVNSPMLWKNPNKLFYVWGHSYEFNDRNNWELIEDFCQKVGGHDYVWYATNIEIYDYVRAYESLVYSADGNTVFNPTTIDVYTCLADKDTLIPAGATVVLNG